MEVHWVGDSYRRLDDYPIKGMGSWMPILLLPIISGEEDCVISLFADMPSKTLRPPETHVSGDQPARKKARVPSRFQN